MILFAFVTLMQLLQYSDHSTYIRDLQNEPLLMMTVKHAVRLLGRMSRKVRDARGLMISVIVYKYQVKTENIQLIDASLEDLFQLQQRIKYSLHLLTTAGVEKIGPESDDDKPTTTIPAKVYEVDPELAKLQQHIKPMNEYKEFYEQDENSTNTPPTFADQGNDNDTLLHYILNGTIILNGTELIPNPNNTELPPGSNPGKNDPELLPGSNPGKNDPELLPGSNPGKNDPELLPGSNPGKNDPELLPGSNPGKNDPELLPGLKPRAFKVETTTVAMTKQKAYFTEAIDAILNDILLYSYDLWDQVTYDNVVSFYVDKHATYKGNIKAYLLSVKTLGDIKTAAKYLRDKLRRKKPAFFHKADEGCNELENPEDCIYIMFNSECSPSPLGPINWEGKDYDCMPSSIMKYLMNSVLLTFRKIIDAGLWDSYVTDCSSLVIPFSPSRSGPKNLLSAPKFNGTSGYITVALKDLVKAFQRKNPVDIHSVIYHWNNEMRASLKKHGLLNTEFGEYVTRNITLTPGKARVYSKLYYKDITGTDNKFVRWGNEALKTNRTMARALINTVDEFMMFREENNGKDSGRMMCKKLIDAFLEVFTNINVDKEIARHNRYKLTNEQKLALSFMKRATAQFQQDILYVEYVLNLNRFLT